MEEPLQPRAAQLRAGALREQSGEAPPGPAQRFFHIPAAPYSATVNAARPPTPERETPYVHPQPATAPVSLSPDAKPNLSIFPSPFPACLKLGAPSLSSISPIQAPGSLGVPFHSASPPRSSPSLAPAHPHGPPSLSTSRALLPHQPPSCLGLPQSQQTGHSPASEHSWVLVLSFFLPDASARNSLPEAGKLGDDCPFFKNLFMLVALGLCCCVWAFLVVASGACSLAVVRGLLVTAVSLVAEHGL